MIYIYTRVSTDAQAEKGDSIEIQINEGLKWASYKYPDQETCIVREEGVSGSVPLNERPKGSVVFNEIKEGDIFFSYKLDRAFRNTSDALHTATEFKKRGVGLVLKNLADEDINTDAIGKLIFTILSAFGELERDTIAGRMQDGKAYRKSKGGFVGGRVPFGWRSVEDPENPTRKIKVPHKLEQAVISSLNLWISEGRTYQAFADMRKESGINKNASAWHKIFKRESS